MDISCALTFAYALSLCIQVNCIKAPDGGSTASAMKQNRGYEMIHTLRQRLFIHIPVPLLTTFHNQYIAHLSDLL